MMSRVLRLPESFVLIANEIRSNSDSNFLFSGTPRRTETSAGMHSIVVTAKANELNPRKCVRWLLEEMPNAENPDDPAYLDSLVPWSESIPAEIRLRQEAARNAAKMADGPTIIDIGPSAFTDEEKRNPSGFSQSKRETPRGSSFYTVVLALTDNSAMKGFFDRLKNKLFRHRDWLGVTIP